MDELLQQIAAYKLEIENQPTNGADSLEAFRIKFLGTKGIVKNLFTEMRNVPADKKKEFGLILNEFKQLAETKFENWKQQLEGDSPTTTAAIDVTLPGDP
jgi:phenylalanyl-tRNA synthetase alpha chain